MHQKNAISELKNNVKTTYNKELHAIRKLEKVNNILRGHIPSMSSMVEDEIAKFILKVTSQKWKIYLDSSISVKTNQNKTKTFRPDMLLLDEKGNVKAIFEIKTSMGYYRDAIKVIEKLINMHKAFIKTQYLLCSFSRKGKEKAIKQEVIYQKDVQRFIITYSDNACDEKHHTQNKANAKKKGICHFILFNGWYDDNEMRYDDMSNFIKQLKKLKQPFM